MQECIKNKNHTKTYISDEQLQTFELSNVNTTNVQCEDLDGEWISQMCRCRWWYSWRGGARGNAWLFVKQSLGRCYFALNGHLPCQMHWLFKIKLLNDHGAFIEYWLALPLPTIHASSGNLDPVSKDVEASTARAGVTLLFFSPGNVDGCLHIIPMIGNSSETQNGWNEWWIVNSHHDLATWKDVNN